MTNTKSTKRALVSSVLALFLCFAMLLGSTFAWFTDSVTSANNVIKSGNLDIELDYWDGASGEWKTVEGTNSLFTNNLWEPGHTEVVYLKLSNLGTLALKYQISINVLSETEGMNKDGDTFKLSDYIQMGVKEGVNGQSNPYADRVDAVADVKDASGIIGNGYVKEGNMLEGADALYMAVVVYMPENIGNDANAKTGTTPPSINLGVQVLATQYTAESDSFNDQYDADATFGTYIELNAGDDLMAAMASAEADMPLTIKLNGNVEWPTEGHHGENDITPASSILIDGNGYTITATGSGVTPLGDTEAPMTLKNVKIVDTSVSYAESSWEFTYLEIGGSSLTCNNVTFADEIMLGTNATFTNCSFESNEESVYAVWVDDGSAAFNNCTFTGYRGLKAHEDYDTEISSVVVKDCTFDNISKKPGIALGTLNADTTVSITDSSFINCQPGDQNLYIYETDTDVSTIKFTNENNIVATSVTNAAELKSALAAGDTNISIAGSITLTESLSANNVTLMGKNEDAAINFAGYNIMGNGSDTITYKDLTLTTISLPYGGAGVGERYGWYGGIDYARHATANYENCTISGIFTLYSTTVNVTGCTFLPYVQDGTTFNQIFQYGTQTANITDCTFNYSNRAIKIYNEGGTKDLVMNVTGCTFKADESFDANYDDNKSLISIDPTFVTSVKLTVKDVTIDDALNGIDLHNAEGNEKITVVTE